MFSRQQEEHDEEVERSGETQPVLGRQMSKDLGSAVEGIKL